MSCQQCGAPLEMTEETGGTKAGQFREEYECVQCNATGAITGQAEAPATEWRHTGSALNDYDF